MNLIPAFFIIDQENIGIRKKHAIKHTTYGITPYICVVKHNCKANGKPHDEKEEGLG